jgi:hypothetical protein
VRNYRIDFVEDSLHAREGKRGYDTIVQDEKGGGLNVPRAKVGECVQTSKTAKHRALGATAATSLREA